MQSLRWRRRLWQQLLCLLACLVLLSCYTIFQIISSVPYAQAKRPLIRPLHSQELLLPNASHLINLREFRYVINSPHLCDGPLYLLNFVHSAPGDFERRRCIRSTWGGVRSVRGRPVRTVFLVGETSSHVQTMLVRESRLYGDVVQGSFVDTYANLSYKHVMGHKWSLEHCNHTKFILKTDEDVYIDMYQLVDFLVSLYGNRPSSQTLMCYVYPTGTPTLRRGKWTVAHTEYPYSEYPRYCAGLAYFVTPDVSRDLVAASALIPFFWIDDVYVTGMLAEALRLRHLSFNLRTTLDAAPLKAWLLSNSTHPSRYIVGSLGDLTNWEELLRRLWRKTLNVYQRKGHLKNTLSF